MARIQHFDLPPNLTEHLVKVLTALPDAYLVELGRECLPGGFTKPRAIRDRLIAMCRADRPLEPWLLRVFTAEVVACSAVLALTRPALVLSAPPLATLYGLEAFVLALLLDERPEIHRFGIEFLDSRATQPELPPWHESEELVRAFLDVSFFAPAGLRMDSSFATPASPAEAASSVGAVSPASAPPPAGRVAELEAAKQRLERLLEDERRRGKEKARELQQQLEQETKRITREREEAQAKLARAQDDKATAEARLTALEQDLRRQVEAGVAAETSRAVRGWLAEAESQAQQLAATQAAAPDLLGRAAQALEKQARQDQHTGNRVALEAQLARFRAARDQLAGALRTALCPLKELPLVLGELETEVRQLETRLGARPAPGPLLESLLVRLNTCSATDCGPLAELLATLGAQRILDAAELRQAQAALQRRLSLLRDKDGAVEGEIAEPGWSLRAVLHRNLPALILIDGHNLLFALAELLQGELDNGNPGARARARLAELVRRLVDPRAEVRARICFDGPNPGLSTVSPNVQIEFSGGQGDHRADAVIEGLLHFLEGRRDGRRVFVVSDDQAVRREALQKGARYVPTALFAVLLQDFGCW